MCGIFGIARPAGARVPLTDKQVASLRDRLAHRGPDSAGLLRRGNVVLAHRRLAVIDPGPAGRQPMVTPDGDGALVYNGELYNDAELRAELRALGVRFVTDCDTETVLHSLARWGSEALARFRGMYALAWHSRRSASLLLARDPLGIKPLYYHAGSCADGAQMVFASEPRAILAHPDVACEPDLVTLSAYLTTIRTTLGRRTLFEGVSTLLPGEVLEIDLRPADGGSFDAQSREPWASAPISDVPTLEEAGGSVRTAVEDSVASHLRADVPSCSLLSGGLDSTIIAAVTLRHDPALRTYCSGAPEAGNSDDLSFARLAASELGAEHTEAPVSREMFRDRWPDMVRRLGLPLGTPNEVAINEVARRLREDRCIVALSGEGADELFGGYDQPLLNAWRHITGGGALHGGEFQLHTNAWTPLQSKPLILQEAIWRAVDQDSVVIGHYRDEFDSLRAQTGDDEEPSLSALATHLRMHRRINLAGLLARLDTATMLESVEGRTPFADARVAGVAEALPMRHRFDPREHAHESGGGAVTAVQTKAALRAAFAGVVPEPILRRPKASFPLPFQTWVSDHAHTLQRSAFAGAVFTPSAVALVAENACDHWRIAWPMINLAMWGDAVWG